MVTKQSEQKENFKRQISFTSSAREGWEQILNAFKGTKPKAKVLLPSYIGRSTNEGSGIFDPVLNSGIDYEFYALNDSLEIEIDKFKNQISNSKDSLVLLVHYFGFPDKNYEELVSFLKANNVSFTEDCAHAWLSDLIGGVCGRNGQNAFYSLHKLLPIPCGGAVVSNDSSQALGLADNYNIDLFQYDLHGIHSKRRANYLFLLNLLKEIDGIQILQEELPQGVCPQTLPVKLKKHNRDDMYFEMNNKGFGMVSLYHTMIDELNNCNSGASKVLSKQIINFPIHQDLEEQDLLELSKAFMEVLDQ